MTIYILWITIRNFIKLAEKVSLAASINFKNSNSNFFACDCTLRILLLYLFQIINFKILFELVAN